MSILTDNTAHHPNGTKPTGIFVLDSTAAVTRILCKLLLENLLWFLTLFTIGKHDRDFMLFSDLVKEKEIVPVDSKKCGAEGRRSEPSAAPVKPQDIKRAARTARACIFQFSRRSAK